MKRVLQDITNTQANPKQPKKNSPTCTDDISQWPVQVLNLFKDKLAKNVNSRGSSYFRVQGMDITQPMALQQSVCHYPTNSNTLMVIYDGKQ